MVVSWIVQDPELDSLVLVVGMARLEGFFRSLGFMSGQEKGVCPRGIGLGLLLLVVVGFKSPE